MSRSPLQTLMITPYVTLFKRRRWNSGVQFCPYVLQSWCLSGPSSTCRQLSSPPALLSFLSFLALLSSSPGFLHILVLFGRILRPINTCTHMCAHTHTPRWTRTSVYQASFPLSSSWLCSPNFCFKSWEQPESYPDLKTEGSGILAFLK